MSNEVQEYYENISRRSEAESSIGKDDVTVKNYKKDSFNLFSFILTVAGEETQSKQDETSFYDFIGDL